VNEPSERARHAPEDLDLEGIDLRDYEDPDLDDVDGPDPEDVAGLEIVDGTPKPAEEPAGAEDSDPEFATDESAESGEREPSGEHAPTERPAVEPDPDETGAAEGTEAGTEVAMVPAVESAVVRTPGYGLAQPDGSVEGYRPGKTLPLRVELARQLRRRRSRLTLGFLLVLPLLLVGAFELGDDGSGGGRSYADIATSSGLNFAVFALYASTSFLLVVVVALFFGDTVASEASWSSLKYLLAAPVPRLRLLRQKAKVAALLSVVALALLSGVALTVGVIWFGTGSLVSPTGESLSFLRGLVMIVAATAYLAVHLSWVAGLALWLSVSTDAPLGAVGGAVLVSILSQILDQIGALGELRNYLPTHFATSYADLFAQDIDWTGMLNGCFAALSYATVFAALTTWRFHRKDITS
jgi:ABC-2 type transport system permease protein